MKRTGLAWFLFTGGFAFSAAAFGLTAQLDSLPTLMSRGDYDVARRVIASETRQALGRCRAVEPAEERNLCKARAKAEDRVKKADLGARYYGTVAAARDAQQARIRASYDVARAQCGSRVGRDRVTCLAESRRHAAPPLALAATPPT
jgi:hypothetical protein